MGEVEFVLILVLFATKPPKIRNTINSIPTTWIAKSPVIKYAKIEKYMALLSASRVCGDRLRPKKNTIDQNVKPNKPMVLIT